MNKYINSLIHISKTKLTNNNFSNKVNKEAT